MLFSGSMIRTVAPLVMAACASASSWASWPWALLIEKSDDLYPACSNAFCRYGWSNWT